jgi:hypothetical protein
MISIIRSLRAAAPSVKDIESIFGVDVEFHFDFEPGAILDYICQDEELYFRRRRRWWKSRG